MSDTPKAEVASVPLAGRGISGSVNALDKGLAKRLFNGIWSVCVGVVTAIRTR
ncbi:hypothetical protein CES85_2993 (plasmid) [Ochrobactrum quorumnocens]|uniref:Uncharacterized protein n=1 Tax=Ochrobactrum quorumnocens TaxID=271865 RepID=A0A248UNM0_9HYPH|nr:hypothetical protein CES85_2993 [[Ochrobactrum] quorumnocens]